MLCSCSTHEHGSALARPVTVRSAWKPSMIGRTNYLLQGKTFCNVSSITEP